MNVTTETKFTARCKAFSTEGVRMNAISVDADGTVRVWDDVARCYTTCHSLSAAAQRRLRKLAKVST